jgi:hypothetical protein
MQTMILKSSSLRLGTLHPDPCPECGGELILKYGRKFKALFYGCRDYPACIGSAGAHSDGRPMGIAVTKDIAFHRRIAHKLVAQLQYHNAWSRNQLYRWMTDLFDVEETVHIANMGIEELRVLFREVQKKIKYG